MNKTFRSILSVVLVIVMCVGLFTPAAFAAKAKKPAEPFKLLCFGDSMSQGYMLADYKASLGGMGSNLSKMSYPWLMTGWLEQQLGREVKAQYYTMQGMRPNELYGILDFENSPELDVYTQKYISNYERNFNNWKAQKPDEAASYGVKDTDTLYTALVSATRDADLITVDMSMNYLGLYLVKRLSAVLSGGTEIPEDYQDHFTELLGELDDTMEMRAEVARQALVLLLDQFDLSVIDTIADAFLYSYGCFMVYFNKLMDKIHELNPDAEVIVVGTFNCFPGVSAKFGDITLDVGSVVGLLYGSMNTYMTTFSPLRSWYKFADCFSGEGVETFIGAIENEDYNETIRNFLIDDVYSMQSSGMFEKYSEDGITGVSGIMLEDIRANGSFADRADEVEAAFGSCADIAAEKALIKAAYDAKGTGNDTPVYEAIRYAMDIIFDAYSTAAQGHLADLSAIFNGSSADAALVIRSCADSDEAGRAIILSRVVTGNSFVGMHPSPRGAAQKFEYVKAAYLSGDSAVETARKQIQGTVIDIGKIVVKKTVTIAFDVVATVAKTVTETGVKLLKGLLELFK